MDSSAESRRDDELASRVRAAAAGDDAAFEALVDRFAGMVWSIARAYRLGDADAADVSQTAWLRLVEHLDRIRRPERLGSWLAATTRNECLRVLRLRGQQVLTGDELEIPDEHAPPLDSALLLSERDAALWQAFQALSPRCRALLQVIVGSPAPTYDELSAALGMPVGSIGPTRARCLERLRRHPEVARVLAGKEDR